MRLLTNVSSVQGLTLVIVVAWALAAVFMLTQTTVAASQIDRRVETIVTEVSAIDEDTSALTVTESINEKAAGILAAAEPLDGQLDTIIGVVGSIDASAVSILDTAEAIGGNVDSIRSTAGSINGTVDSIHGNFVALAPVVDSIQQGVVAINGRADKVLAIARGLRSDSGNVLARVVDIDGHAESIDCTSALTPLTACVAAADG